MRQLNNQLIAVKRLACLLVAWVVLSCSNSVAADSVFRFGTGGSEGAYFPVGSLIAAEINKHNQNVDTQNRLTVIPQRSNGSVANIRDLSLNLLEIGLVQADVVSLAYQGKGLFESENYKDTLRTIGTLFQESVHLVVAADSSIFSVEDLVGKRLSVDEIGSGTQFDAERILAGAGISLTDIKPIYLKPVDSIDRMRRGLLDAIFIVSAYPMVGVEQLVEDGVGRLVSLGETLVTRLATQHRYFSEHSFPAGAYLNNEEIHTLSVSAQLIVRSDISAETVYSFTKNLWSDSTLAALASGHPRGADISTDTALHGIVLPLHDGAERYYLEHDYDVSSIPKQ